MQDQHTQEPWYASKEDDNWRVMAADENGGYTLADMYCDDQEANARRIVACVNACAGIETDKLEGRTIAEYVSNEAYVKAMLPTGGGMSLEVTGIACQMLAASFAGQFVGSEAINFLEVGMSHSEIGDFTVTIQRNKGKTPGQLKAEAEKQRDDLLAALNFARQGYQASSENGEPDEVEWAEMYLRSIDVAIASVKENK